MDGQELSRVNFRCWIKANVDVLRLIGAEPNAIIAFASLKFEHSEHGLGPCETVLGFGVANVVRKGQFVVVSVPVENRIPHAKASTVRIPQNRSAHMRPATFPWLLANDQWILC